MEVFVAMGALLAMVKNLTDLVRRATSGDVKGALTILMAYVLGVGTVFLFAASDYADSMDFGGMSLGSANAFSKIIIGVAVGAAAGLAKDVLKAVDNNQSEEVPKLGG